MADIEQTTNTVLAVKLDYMQKDIFEIKTDVKELRGEYISRREATQLAKELEEKTSARFVVGEERVSRLYSIVYWFMGILGTATLVSFFKLIFK